MTEELLITSFDTIRLVSVRLWTPLHRSLLSPHLRLCTLKEGQRTLLHISTWATTGVTTLWSHFKEHVHALDPLPTLPTALPDTPAGYSEPPAPLMDPSASETPVRPARESPSPPPKRQRIERPPPEPPPWSQRMPPTAQAPRSPTAFTTATHPTRSPQAPRSPWTTLASADHG